MLSKLLIRTSFIMNVLVMKFSSQEITLHSTQSMFKILILPNSKRKLNGYS